jgi:hypothetical protein
VVTSQYTVHDFLFKNLWKQFHRPANVYFLFISGLQCIKVRGFGDPVRQATLAAQSRSWSLEQAVSITNGVPTTLLPLVFVLTVTALKDAIEDFNRCVKSALVWPWRRAESVMPCFISA